LPTAAPRCAPTATRTRDLPLRRRPLGWLGGRGTASTTPLTAGKSDPESVFGAATAAVLGAAAVFRLAHDQTIRTTRFNPVELAADDDAGDRDHRTPIDVGDVLAIGARAVTSALVYWLRELGITHGTWDFLDRDDAELHNTNRCMTMTAAHSGWPNSEPATAAANKAGAVAEAIGRPHPVWYDQWQPHRQPRHDLVLPLASPDAALPFLSAAGLMLAAALAALPGGPAMTGRMNHWQLDLTLSAPLISPHQHEQRQVRREPPSTLRRLIRESSS
jgi:hypothetical protein